MADVKSPLAFRDYPMAAVFGLILLIGARNAHLDFPLTINMNVLRPVTAVPAPLDTH